MPAPLRIHYACLAMLDLAEHAAEGAPAQVREIAARKRIPYKYLTQILPHLKGAGLLRSRRGAAGGYELARNPDQISVWQVVQALGGLSGSNPSTRTDSEQDDGALVLASVWQELLRQQQRVLSEFRFGELLRRSRAAAESMYHI